MRATPLVSLDSQCFPEIYFQKLNKEAYKEPNPKYGVTFLKSNSHNTAAQLSSITA
jgi:hypothetical protein